MRVLRFIQIGAGFAVAATIAVVATAPLGSRAADHLDAPNLAQREDADINDVYVFQASKPGRTAIAVTTSPAAGVIGPLNYATNVRYKINVDQNGDAVEDLAFVLDFSAPSGGSQRYTVTRYKGANARSLAHGNRIARGRTGIPAKLEDGGRVFAGLRADPFFFDLAAFRHVVLGQTNGRTGFCDQANHTGLDFFKDFNTNAIVLEMRNKALTGRDDDSDRDNESDRNGSDRDNGSESDNGSDNDNDRDNEGGGTIGVWATTLDRQTGSMIDQMGRPAINTVFNHTQADKEAFNVTPPSQQSSTAKPFRTNIIETLKALGGYTQTAAEGLANILLPDVLTYNVGTSAAGPLNGRALADDVIDVELNLVTGGGTTPGTGAIPSDCVGAHTYLSVFPYVNVPHVAH